MSQKKFIIDADTGSDDAVAILMALRDPRVDVLGVTVVSGNVPLKQGIINTLSTAELCDVEIKVFAGADKLLPSFGLWLVVFLTYIHTVNCSIKT